LLLAFSNKQNIEDNLGKKLINEQKIYRKELKVTIRYSNINLLIENCPIRYNNIDFLKNENSKYNNNIIKINII
jgi:hypothetical protein